MATRKKGDGLLLVYSDVAPEHDEEYNRWYNEEHIPSGFRSRASSMRRATRRYRADQSTWRPMSWTATKPGTRTRGRNG